MSDAGNQKTQLYRHFDAEGSLLYVGISLSFVNRLSQHKDHSHWFDKISRVEVRSFPTRQKALEAEKAAIQNENPKFNIAHSKSKVVQIHKVGGIPGAAESRKGIVANVKPAYSYAEAGSLLGVSANTISKMVRDGHLGSTQLGPVSKKIITGWQMIDFLEAMQAKSSKPGKIYASES
jgi:excisionase family DNA binding protein